MMDTSTLQDYNIEFVQIPNKDNEFTCICSAKAKTKDGKAYSEIGICDSKDEMSNNAAILMEKVRQHTLNNLEYAIVGQPSYKQMYKLHQLIDDNIVNESELLEKYHVGSLDELNKEEVWATIFTHKKESENK